MFAQRISLITFDTLIALWMTLSQTSSQMPQYFFAPDFDGSQAFDSTHGMPFVTTDNTSYVLNQPWPTNFELWNPALMDSVWPSDSTYKYEGRYGNQASGLTSSYDYGAHTVQESSLSVEKSVSNASSPAPSRSPSLRSTDEEERYQKRRQQNRAA